MQLPFFVLKCTLLPVRAARHWRPVRVLRRFVGRRARVSVHRLVVHSPSITTTACRWIPLALVAGLTAGAPIAAYVPLESPVEPRSAPAVASSWFGGSRDMPSQDGSYGPSPQAQDLYPSATEMVDKLVLAASLPKVLPSGLLLPLGSPIAPPAFTNLSAPSALPLIGPPSALNSPATAMPPPRLDAQVPEPSTFLLLPVAGLALLVSRRKQVA